MAKGGIGKLAKLKCMLKKWKRNSTAGRAHHHLLEEELVQTSSCQSDDEDRTSSFTSDMVPNGMHPVYVGKSRRRYLVGTHIVGHPLFRVLVQRSGDETSDSDVVVECEVVLFEHLLWMLENADPIPESLDELVDFYAGTTE